MGWPTVRPGILQIVKSFGLPLEDIAAPDSLLHAWHRYRSGKRRRPSVAAFEIAAESRILDLSDDLLAGRYLPGPYDLLRIFDPKARLIAVAPVRDRVLHRALYDTLAPGFQRSYIEDSYACLKGRGSHRAILRFLQLMRRHRYLLHLDLANYFPSIDHGILLDLLRRKLRDRRLVRVLETILRSGAIIYRRPEVMAFYGEPDPEVPRGLPIGNLTSQWWANLYLNAFDHFAKRQLRAPYLRYMDDLVFFADQPAQLRTWRDEVRSWLWEHRRLRLNPRKGHIRPTRLPHTYLGYRISPAGFDLGPKAQRRFKKRQAKLAELDPEVRQATLAAWWAAAIF